MTEPTEFLQRYDEGEVMKETLERNAIRWDEQRTTCATCGDPVVSPVGSILWWHLLGVGKQSERKFYDHDPVPLGNSELQL